MVGRPAGVVAGLTAEQQKAWRELAGEPSKAALPVVIISRTGPDGRPYLRMFGQLRESAEQRLWPDFRRTATTGAKNRSRGSVPPEA